MVGGQRHTAACGNKPNHKLSVVHTHPPYRFRLSHSHTTTAPPPPRAPVHPSGLLSPLIPSLFLTSGPWGVRLAVAEHSFLLGAQLQQSHEAGHHELTQLAARAMAPCDAV